MSKVESLLNGFILSLFIFSVGCASGVKGVDYPDSANPVEEAAKLDGEMKEGFRNHWDVLAEDDFSNAQKQLEKAKRQLASDAKKDKVLDTLGMAQGYLNRAKEKAESLEVRMQGILEARTGALNAGVRNFPAEARKLKAHDDDVRAEIDNISKGKTSTDRWSSLQRGYMILEVLAVQNTKLGDADNKIDSAIRNGAKRNTPNTLKQAELDVQNARNVIAANRNDAAAIEPAVRKANESAQLLIEVLGASKRPEGVIPEDTALAIVMKNRQMGAMNEKLNQINTASGEQGRQLAEQSKKLQTTEATLALDKALESARKEFTADEAEVYRQGDKLLIRLKAVNFESGRADLPEKAIPLLSKVKTIAEELNPMNIVVEGHTDSTGQPGTNKVLSQNRAEAVVTYFTSNGIDQEKIQAVGLGYERPIVTNKTKEGRAQNRRVDVIITPSTGSTSL